MSNITEASSSIFAFLKTQATAQNKMTVRLTEIETSLGPMAHAIDRQGFATLLIPVDEQEIGIGEWKNQSVTVDYRQIGIDDAVKDFLVLQCRSSGLHEQFSLLADDILEAVACKPNRAPGIALETLERWKELLRDQRKPLLSDEQLIGVMGELLFLEELLSVHGPDAITSWQGPLGARHDFDFHNSAVEIKSTLSRDSFPAVFHGAKQLEAPVNRELFVRGYQFEKTIAGNSIPQVLSRLFVGGFKRYEILNLLENIGYSESDSSNYEGRKFEVLAQKTSLVDDDFPKLTVGTVSEEILDQISMLRYTVDLNLQTIVALDIPKLELRRSE